MVGQWGMEGYSFRKSKGIINDQFAGLAIDEDNQPELTTERLRQWITGLAEAGFPFDHRDHTLKYRTES
jgi:flavodoxin I